MRKSLLMVAVPVSVLGLGLAGFMAMRMASKAPADGFAKELEQADAAGIQLAQEQTSRHYTLNETVPETKPEAKTVTKQAPSGAKAVRSKAPTVKAAPEPVAADVVEEIPDLTAVAPSSGPAHAEASVPSMPDPSPATTPAPARDQGPILRGGSGSGNGGGIGMGTAMGVIFGSVIRGGGVDGDNCDPRPRRSSGSRGGATITQSPDYGRNPSGMAGVRNGGWGGATAGATIATSRPRGR